MLPIPKKAVTEEDVKATEARLAASFNGLKTSITNIPSDMARPITDTVREHPYLTVAAAAAGGFVLYSLLNVLIPRTKVVEREVTVQPHVEVKEQRAPSLASKLLSEAIPFLTPYITGYVQNELSRIISKKSEPSEDVVNVKA
ncbi:hypothetical protein MCP_2270 [Methanocella paludicola SANAE]|uniref:Uncharacterized protein n=1 Tax=Methanocella paludicola (strain DSM 17711 / JCM 13418 / NBRC 101707 / SANAE) TaxID=304371 RepID=D1Z0X0_METPS|nr:hypothetical protein [Methanocella paludicola]BAI62342.1 hypothetical protein MCP_2270 [Methanocella paludicola SANAE]